MNKTDRLAKTPTVMELAQLDKLAPLAPNYDECEDYTDEMDMYSNWLQRMNEATDQVLAQREAGATKYDHLEIV